MKYVVCFFVLTCFNSLMGQGYDYIPRGFIDAKVIIEDLDVDLKYAYDDNFLGRPVDGYILNKLMITVETAFALKKVQDELKTYALGLRVYDGYRPQRAVDDFVSWAKLEHDTITKSKFYPDFKKSELFKYGYIALKSGHSRGSTVDLTIIDLETQEVLDMGSDYDFFGEISSVDYENLTEDQKLNRQLLQQFMTKHGFKGYSKEWWHFTLKNERYPKTYFNFIID